MTSPTTWLIDRSALIRLQESGDADAWLGRIDSGLIRISTPTRLEVGFSARSESDWVALMNGPLITKMPLAVLRPAMESRAREVQRQLTARGHHRAPSIPDLLIAAIAEVDGFVVLHVDKDFELIAEVTGQPVERLAL